MKFDLARVVGLSILLSLPFALEGANLGTRQRTICPVALSTNTAPIPPNDVPDYAVYGYSAWQWDPARMRDASS